MKVRYALTAATAIAALAGLPLTAHAAGVNLAWNDCGTAGISNRTFNCAVNTGTETLFASFIPPAGINALCGAVGTINLASAGATLPSWWHYSAAGTCRRFDASTNWDFTSGPLSCVDPWQGAASAGMAYDIGFGGSNRARLRAVGAIPLAYEGPVSSSYEYYAFKITINHQKSVGTGSCPGCIEPVCLVLNDLEIDNRTGPNTVVPYHLTAPLNANYVTWQGPYVGCPAAVPARNHTWGQIKSLYH